jgi:hypothetical protein
VEGALMSRNKNIRDRFRKSANVSRAAIAAALMTFPGAALGQSFSGTPTVEFGSVTITTPVNTTNIEVSSPRAVINWSLPATPGSTPVIFQPSNTTANFISGTGIDYVVLNRILPTDLTREVQFNGTVNADGNNGVFFYSPGGIVLGSSAVFNVSRLLLTTNNVAVDGNGGFFLNNDIELASTSSGSTSAVTINPGARINALPEGSFVLAVAPRVIDSGATVVNGSKALVAGEFVDLTYDAGLFDISVTQGTGASGEVLRHDGSTTGPASGGSADFHRIYMVAVPSNTAISMFVSGANGLGFDVAGAANIVDNAIVLSGGSNIVEASGNSGAGSPFAQTPVSAVAADINITGGVYSSAVNARSNNDVTISNSLPGSTSFAGDLLVQARQNAALNITSGAVTINGEFRLSADAESTASNGTDQQGGNASVVIAGSGSTLTTNNFATVSANGTGADSFSIGDGGDGTGGDASVRLNGGAWNANAGLRVVANGTGGSGNTGGAGIGGSVTVSSASGSLLVERGFFANSDGAGGSGVQTGGIGTGGSASVSSTGPSSVIGVSVADGFFVTARGEGGSLSNAFGGNGGNGTGGNAGILADNGGRLTTAVQINAIDASGTGGGGGTFASISATGGSGIGGSGSIDVQNNGSIQLTGANSTTAISAAGIGGSGNTGGVGTGGALEVTNLSGGNLQIDSGFFSAQSSGIGGIGLNGDGGIGTGGNLTASLQGTSTFAGNAILDSSGIGGAGSAAGGIGTGGSVLLNSSGATTFSQSLNLLAFSNGGTGVDGGNGSGTAGSSARITVSAGNLSLAQGAGVTATGTGGDSTGGGNGGDGTGALAAIDVTGGAVLSSLGYLILSTGTGGTGLTGGAGTGGTARLSVTGGQLSAGETVRTDAAGRGGQGTQTGGGAIGGNASVLVNGAAGSLSITTAGEFVVTAAATAGAGIDSISGTGGNAAAGTANLSVSNGAVADVAVGAFAIEAFAQGGFGQAGSGGNAVAGTAQARADSGASITLPGAQTALLAYATGGDGTAGGSANGGIALLAVNTGSTLSTGTGLLMNTYANGGAGNSGAGGNAVGGSALLNTQGTTNVAGAALFDSHGAGGTSASGGDGGNGTGGSARILSAGATTFASTVTAVADGSGGDGVTGGTGTGTSGLNSGTKIEVSGGTLNIAGNVALSNSAFGGTGAGAGNGGAAQGGDAIAFITAGNITLSGTLTITGTGTGGTGRNGGDGSGGTAGVILRGGGMNITSGVLLNASGLGANGAAGLGGTGGNGVGGNARFVIDNTASNLSLSAGSLTARARGDGGNGGDASAAMVALGLPVAGGGGGTGSAGTIDIGSTGSAGNLNIGAVGAEAIAIGGNGGSGGTIGAGGNGGIASGGLATIGFNAAASAVTGTFNAASIIAVSSAQGGNGSTGTIDANGGNAFAGNVFFGNGSGGTVAIANQVGGVANAIGGFGAVSGTGDAGNAIVFSSSNPNGGASGFTAASVSLVANGFRRFTPTAAQLTGRYGRAAVVANGGNISVGSTFMTALGSSGQSAVAPAFGIINSGLLARNASLQISGSFTGQFAGDAALAADNGSIDFFGTGTNGFDFITPGDIVETLTGSPPAASGAVRSNTFLNINSGGSILTPGNNYSSQSNANIVASQNLIIGNAEAGDYLRLQSGSNMIAGTISGGDIFEAVSGGTMALGNIRANSDVDLLAAGAVNTGTISSGDTVTIGSGGAILTGDIDAGIVNPSSGPDVAYAVGLRALGNITTGAITAQNRIGLGAEGGSITTGAIGTGQYFVALADTGVTVNGGIVTGNGANGVTYIADYSMASLIDPVTLDPSALFAAAPVALDGNVTISGPVTTGRFVAASSDAFVAGGAINADVSALIDAGGLASFGGIVDAPDITVTSADLDLGTNSGLGSAATATLNINSQVGASAVQIGGDGGTGFVIDGNEMARLHGASIRFRAGGTAPPAITIGSFTLQGSAGTSPNLIGSAGSFAIETPRSVRVTGAAAINNTAADNAFSIRAGGRIDIVTDAGGSIRLSNTSSDPSGILSLTAGTVAAASAALITQLTQDPGFAGRDDALNAAAAIPLSQGFLQSGTMNVTVRSGLFIQNSNTVQSPGGFTVGAGGFNASIPAGVTGPVDLVINGRALDAVGAYLTGKDTLRASDFAPLSSFAPGATLNACLITGAPCGTVTVVNDFGFISAQQANAIENNEDDEDKAITGEVLPVVLLGSLVNVPADDTPPPITEPVTGTGNAEAWTPAATGEQP